MRIIICFPVIRHIRLVGFACFAYQQFVNCCLFVGIRIGWCLWGIGIPLIGILVLVWWLFGFLWSGLVDISSNQFHIFILVRYVFLFRLLISLLTILFIASKTIGLVLTVLRFFSVFNFLIKFVLVAIRLKNKFCRPIAPQHPYSVKLVRHSPILSSAAWSRPQVHLSWSTTVLYQPVHPWSITLWKTSFLLHLIPFSDFLFL